MPTLCVRDLMTTELVTLDEDEDLDLADQLMRLTRVRHLPVLKDGRLVGLVSQRDVLKAQSTRLMGTTAEEQRAMSRWVKAGWIMTRELQLVEPEMPLLEAAQLMHTQKYGCLLVVEGGRLVGILTEADFVAFAIRVLSGPGA